MLQSGELEKLLSIVASEGQGCECPEKSTCKRQGKGWCHYISNERARGKIIEYEDLLIAPCMYRERPGCCWVLTGVEKLATDYLNELDVYSPPVPMNLLHYFDDKREIELQHIPLKCHHGAAWLIDDEWIVQINASDSLQVRRQTIFHEAFHIACRSSNLAFKRVDMTHMPFRDILADHFSTCLLMHKNWIEEYWEMSRDVQKMAEIFDVPVSSMDNRLMQLGLTRSQDMVKNQ